MSYKSLQVHIPKTKNFKQGYYEPINPEKYRGNINNIFYRSSWERVFMTKYCDKNPNCVLWASEEVAIPYFNPLDGKMHNYIVDFFCVLKEENNKYVGVLIEIKPHKELSPPVLKEQQRFSAKRIIRYNKQAEEYIKNMAKWEAAKIFALQRGYKFLVITEKQLGIK